MPPAMTHPSQTAAAPPGDFSHILLSYVVPAYVGRGTPAPVASLLETYARYNAVLLDRTQFVVVDDGSPQPVAVPEALHLNVLVLRIHEDIPWNQPGARNLGLVCARSDKVILTDLDHELSEETFLHILSMKPLGRTMYKMDRVDAGGTPLKPHPNTFVLSRGRFLELHGYDEEFCGHYGFDDAMFWRWQRNNGTRFLRLPAPCRARVRSRDVAEYHALVRDLSHNRALADAKKEAWRRHGPEAGHSRRFLSFTWGVAQDLRRDASRVVRRPHPWWTRTWSLRWLLGGP
jgi:hypothetical protein